MEATHSENIPKTNTVIRSNTSIVNGTDNDDAPQPSSSNRTVDGTTATENASTTNTHILEIAAMLLFFSWNLTGIVFQNQVLYQSCIILEYNASTCEDVPDDSVNVSSANFYSSEY